MVGYRISLSGKHEGGGEGMRQQVHMVHTYERVYAGGFGEEDDEGLAAGMCCFVQVETGIGSSARPYSTK